MKKKINRRIYGPSIVRMYVADKIPALQIARRYNVSDTLIYNILKARGITQNDKINYKTNRRRILTAQWRNLTKSYRAAVKGLCELCTGRAIDVHHKIPVSVDKSLEFVWSNLIAVCLSCHRAQHLELPYSFFRNRFQNLPLTD